MASNEPKEVVVIVIICVLFARQTKLNSKLTAAEVSVRVAPLG